MALTDQDLLDEEEEAAASTADTPDEDIAAAAPREPAVDTAPAGIATPATMNDPDFLRQYFANRALSQQRVSHAEDTAETNRLFARLGGAASTIASGVAKAPDKPDQAPFEGLAKDAEAPVARAEKAAVNETNNEKILRDYFTRQQAIKTKADTSKAWQGLKETANTETERHHRAMENKPVRDPNAGFTFRDAQLAKREHAKLMARIDRDPTLRNQLTQVTNMQNAMAATENAVKEGKPLTAQQMDETQQAVLASLGLKGQQSVGEREKKQFDSLGLNGARVVQFLTSKPQDIGKDNPLYQHVRDLARWESGNVASQYQEQLDNITAGQGWLYDENPKLKRDLDKKMATLTGHVKSRQFGSGEAPGQHGSPGGAPAPTPSPVPPGKVRVIEAASGKTGFVPADQAAAAIKSGKYKLAQ